MSTTIDLARPPGTDAQDRTGGSRSGRVVRVSGPVIEVSGLPDVRLFDVVRVGADRLPGEVIRLDGDLATVQVFEDTTGLRVGEPVLGEGAPLFVELGPGLLGGVFDGTQRPLDRLRRDAGIFVPRGSDPPRLDRDRRWDFAPVVESGTLVGPGDVLGTVAETPALLHRVLVPPGVSGTVGQIRAGSFPVTEPVAQVGDVPVAMLQRWPVRTARPVSERLPLAAPMLTGQRVLDALFPVARGGTAIIPGGFGTGKTVLEQAVAKHSAADVVVYIGCGERGNELTEVLEDFPTLTDPRTGAPLMDRTVLVANTSNMPVAAREASVYVGMTIAEYYRDQGYDVALLADSTSRWGEALREVSSRLEEIPAEDGYPAYLATRLSAFYERAGAVECLGTDQRRGSVTLVGAVSPAGGDFSEPVTQNSLRVAGCFWGLDSSLARQRHFPSVNWTRSYSGYRLDGWFDDHVDADWSALRAWAAATLATEGSLQEIVSLLGIEAIAAQQRITLRLGRALREDFLQQSSFDDTDASCSPHKMVAMLRALRRSEAVMAAALEREVPAATIVEHPVLAGFGQMRRWRNEEDPGAQADRLVHDIEVELGALAGEGGTTTTTTTTGGQR